MRCEAVAPSGGSRGGSLVVELGELATDCRLGDSVAVSGVCLTITRLHGATATFGLSPETLSGLAGGPVPRRKVNIERPEGQRSFRRPYRARPVDGVATIRLVRKAREFADIEFAAGTGTA